LTTTVTLAVCCFPAASRAVADRTCWPFGTVALFHVAAYGSAATSAPRLTPSIANCTPTTATLSDADAPNAIVPVTVEFAAGPFRATAGGVVSLNTVTGTDATRWLPAA